MCLSARPCARKTLAEHGCGPSSALQVLGQDSEQNIKPLDLSYARTHCKKGKRNSFFLAHGHGTPRPDKKKRNPTTQPLHREIGEGRRKKDAEKPNHKLARPIGHHVRGAARRARPVLAVSPRADGVIAFAFRSLPLPPPVSYFPSPSHPPLLPSVSPGGASPNPHESHRFPASSCAAPGPRAPPPPLPRRARRPDRSPPPFPTRRPRSCPHSAQVRCFGPPARTQLVFAAVFLGNQLFS